MAHSGRRRRHGHGRYHGGHRMRQARDRKALDHQDQDYHRIRQPEAGTATFSSRLTVFSVLPNNTRPTVVSFLILHSRGLCERENQSNRKQQSIYCESIIT